MIIKPMWTCGIQLWGCTKNSNRLIIQRLQNGIIRTITNARWYQRNEDLHRDLDLKLVNDIIKDFAKSHEMRLTHHTNTEATLLLNSEDGLRRLKRNKPHDLTL